MEWLIFALSYGVGALPFGVWVAKSRGVDILKEGSGNPGATNVARVLGKGPGTVVMLLDILKGAIPAALAWRFTGQQDIGLVAGVCAIVGHSLSPFLRFKGGKGIATGLGMLIGSQPLVAAATLGTFLAGMALFRIVSLASLVAAASVLLWGWLFGATPLAMGVLLAIVLFVFWRHRSNIDRLRRGTEPKFRFKTSQVESPPPS